MRFRKGTTRATSGVDMTPMIDMVFQLIIFFLFTSQFVTQTRIALRLPEQRGEQIDARQAAAVIIDVRESGQMLVEQREVDIAGLAQIVQRQAVRYEGQIARVKVLVRAEDATPASVINAIAQVLDALGVQQWQLGTTGREP